MLLVIGFIFISAANAQKASDSLALDFRLLFNQESLQLNKKYISAQKDTVTIETFRCYISDIQIHYADKTIFSQENSHHLLDSDNPSSFRIFVTKKTDKIITAVLFHVGIDSLTSNSGALSGSLDPAKGMYWAWQSGYINIKIEGKSPSCKTRKNQFQFHIGGYLEPYYALRNIVLLYDKKATQLNVGIDLNVFFSTINLSETNSIMIPGAAAMQLADASAKMFQSL